MQVQYFSNKKPSDSVVGLALLRTTIGRTQWELANLLECSLPTIRAIEQKKLALSGKLAQKLANETGVSISWLLDGDATRPPMDANEVLITEESFERHQVNLVRRRTQLPPGERTDRILATQFRNMTSILVSAECKGNQDLVGYKIGEALEKLKRQFGFDKELAPKPVSQGGKMLLHGGKQDLQLAMKDLSSRRRVLALHGKGSTRTKSKQTSDRIKR